MENHQLSYWQLSHMCVVGLEAVTLGSGERVDRQQAVGEKFPTSRLS